MKLKHNLPKLKQTVTDHLNSNDRDYSQNHLTPKNDQFNSKYQCNSDSAIVADIDDDNDVVYLSQSVTNFGSQTQNSMSKKLAFDSNKFTFYFKVM